MKYKVEIKRIGHEDREVSGEYTVVGQDDDGKNVYGYAPRHVKTVEVNEKVYEQTIEDLDIPSIVTIINRSVKQYIVPADSLVVDKN